MTRKQRHDVYVKMLAHRNGDPEDVMGFCWDLLSIRHFLEKRVELRHLPELTKYKPTIKVLKKNSWYWFDVDEAGMEKRNEILREAIVKTSKPRKWWQFWD